MSKKEEFYTKLKSQLEDTTSFPADYMYKFIVPSNENQEAEVQDLFNNKGAIITTKKSKTGKYISVSIVLKVENSEEVISYYQKAEKIKAPTLILYGENDKVVTEQMAKDINNNIGKNAQLKYLKNCGHSPLIDDLDQLIENIIDFIN